MAKGRIDQYISRQLIRRQLIMTNKRTHIEKLILQHVSQSVDIDREMVVGYGERKLRNCCILSYGTDDRSATFETAEL